MTSISRSGFKHSLSRNVLSYIKQCFGFLSCLLIALQPMMVELAHAQEIIIDPNGNVGFAPTMQRPSRPQVVDIARPNAGGVSHNKYTQFNVPDDGAVLNNSKESTNTQVAGTISGNPNLTGGTAATILNEVTSTSDTTLTGSIEVAGDRAGVIIANPNGILCNGCNFINASNGTLTTGVPVVEGGNVRLNVAKGAVTIGRRGLEGAADSAGAVSDINLIGRTVVIDGKVTAINGINIQGGAQSYDLTNQRQVSKLTGTGAAPDLVIDGTEYGAMSAGRIQIIGNESGLGVRTLGAVQSSTEGVRIVSQGDATVRSVSAQGRVDIQANQGSLALERDVSSLTADILALARYDVNTTNLTGLFGSKGVIVKSKNRTLRFSGVVQSGEDITLFGRKSLYFFGHGWAKDDFKLNGVNGITVDGAKIFAKRVVATEGGTSFTLKNSAVFSSENFNINTGDFILGKKVIVDGLKKDDKSSLVVTASGDFRNSADMRHYDAATINFAGNLYNNAGGFIKKDKLKIAVGKEVHNSGVIYGVTSIDIDVSALFNKKTGVILSNKIDINTTGLLSNAGSISSEGDIHLAAGTGITNDGYIQGGRASLTANEIKNSGGSELRVRDGGSITATAHFINQGILSSLASLDIKADHFENKGLVSVENGINANANIITNHDVLTSGNMINLRAETELQNLGTLASYEGATLYAGSAFENRGKVLVDDTLSISGPLFRNVGPGAIVRAKSGDIKTASIRNFGSVYLISSFQRRGDIDLFENSGVFATQGHVQLSGRDDQSRIILVKDSNLIAGLKSDDKEQKLLNTSDVSLSFASSEINGRLVAGRAIKLSAPKELLINGALDAREKLYLTADVVTISTAAKIQAGVDGFIAVAEQFKNDGVVLLSGSLKIDGGINTFGNAGYISTGGVNFTVNGDFENTGSIKSTKDITVNALNISNRGHVQAERNARFTANKTTKNEAGENVVTLGSIHNAGTITSKANTHLVGGDIHLDTTTYLATEHLQINANNFKMQGNATLTGSDRNNWIIAQQYQQYGKLFAQGALRVEAGSYEAHQNSLLGSSDDIAIDVTEAAGLSGSLTAKNITINAAEISGSETSSLSGSEELNLLAENGKISHFGELVAGQKLVVNSGEFDIGGNTFAKNVNIYGVSQGHTRGKIYGSDAVDVNLSEGDYHNYGLSEARRILNIKAKAVKNYADAQLSSTQLNVNTAQSITNEGQILGASKVTLNAGSDVVNQRNAKIKAVSLGLKSKSFSNRGELDLYGFFGNVADSVDNYGKIKAKTYFGLHAANFLNRTGASVASDDHLFVKVSHHLLNEKAATLRGSKVDFRGGRLTNGGSIEAKKVVNIADLTGAFENTGSGSIHAKTISILAGGALSNKGKIGQRASNNLPKSDEIYMSAGDSVTNLGQIEATNLTILAQSTIINQNSLRAHAGTLALKAKTGDVINHASMYAQQAIIEGAGTLHNRSTINASENITIITGKDIRNRNIRGSYAHISAKVVVLRAAGAVSTSAGSRISGSKSLGIEARGGDIQNNGIVAGSSINLIAKNGAVYSTTGISSNGSLAVEARNMVLGKQVSVTNRVTLKSTHYDIQINDKIRTKQLIVEAAQNIKSRGAAFQGTDLTQLIADDVQRLDGNNGSNNTSRKLAIISGAKKDIFFKLRKGNIGALVSSVHNETGHKYDVVNWNVTGSVAIIAERGNIALKGNIRSGTDLHVRSGHDTVVGDGTFHAGRVLHLEGHRYLKKYGVAGISAGQKVQVLQNAGWFYTGHWFGRDMRHDLSVKAKNIVVNKSHRLINKDIYLHASNDIRQKDEVISARKITYSAGRDIFVRFNPFNWRKKYPTAANTNDWWDVQSAGLRGNNLIAQSQGMTLYAGRNVTLQSGKLRTSGSINIFAGNTFLSEPIYRDNNRTARPKNVGWLFSGKYKGVLAGHDASKVKIREMRAYQNQISAVRDVNITAGGSANFIGSWVIADRGNISIRALTGSVNMVAAPGYWAYNYTQTTSKKKIFGIYRRTTKYEFDAANDIYKRTTLQAKKGNIKIQALGEDGRHAAILSAGTVFRAKNISIETPNGYVSSGTYTERSVKHEHAHSSTKIFWFVPFGSEDTKHQHDVLINYGSRFLADEQLKISAPKGTLSITGGTIRAKKVNISAANLEIKAAINSARKTYYSRRDNMVTITTIQSGFDRETADLPKIVSPNVNFNITGETNIRGHRGATLNNQLINLISTRKFDDATLGLASPSDLSGAQTAAKQIDQQYIRHFDLPGAADGQQFAYLDTLVRDYGATYHTIKLRDREWYDKQVQLNPAFRALLQAVATYITGSVISIDSVLVNAGVNAATTNLIVGVVEGTITGNLDMDEILRGALLAGATASISKYLGDKINLGSGLSDTSPFHNDLEGTFAPSAITNRLGDKVVSQVVSNVVHGEKPFEGFNNFGRTFLVSETMALAQFGVGELGNGKKTEWEGSVGHFLLHGGVGCVALEAMNGNCTAGFFAGASSSVLAGAQNLSPAQKRELAPLVGAIAGYLASGGKEINVGFGGTISQSAIEHNYLIHEQLEALKAAIDKQCAGMVGVAFGQCATKVKNDEGFNDQIDANRQALDECIASNQAACLLAHMRELHRARDLARTLGQEYANLSHEGWDFGNATAVRILTNHLSVGDISEALDRQKKYCDGRSDAGCVQALQDLRALEGQKKRLAALGIVIDFVPVAGDVKGFVDCGNSPSLGACAGAVAGLLPLLGDGAKLILKGGDEVMTVTRQGDTVVTTKIDDVPSGATNTGARTFPKWRWGNGLITNSQADEAYRIIASSKTDVDAIARNMGLNRRSTARLQMIKDYLFKGNNDIPNFQADPAIATAWHRMRTGASKGAQRESDMLLLKHEVAEIWIKKNNPGISHAEAHRRANARHNWEETIPWLKFED